MFTRISATFLLTGLLTGLLTAPVAEAQSADPQCLANPTSDCVLAMADAGYRHMHSSLKVYDHVVQDYAEALALVGRTDEAIAIRDAMTRDYSRQSVDRAIGKGLILQGDFDAALAASVPNGDPARRADVLAGWALTAGLGVGPDQKLAFAMEALKIWDTLGGAPAPQQVSLLLWLDRMEEAQATADRTVDPLRRLYALSNIFGKLQETGDTAGMAAMFDRVDAVRDALPADRISDLRSIEAAMRLAVGDTDTMMALVEQETDERYLPYLLHQLIFRAAQQDDAATVDALTERQPSAFARAGGLVACIDGARRGDHPDLAEACLLNARKTVQVFLFLSGGQLPKSEFAAHGTLIKLVVAEAMAGNELMSKKLMRVFDSQSAREGAVKAIVRAYMDVGDYPTALSRALTLSPTVERPEMLAEIAESLANAGR